MLRLVKADECGPKTYGARSGLGSLAGNVAAEGLLNIMFACRGHANTIMSESQSLGSGLQRLRGMADASTVANSPPGHALLAPAHGP